MKVGLSVHFVGEDDAPLFFPSTKVETAWFTGVMNRNLIRPNKQLEDFVQKRWAVDL